MQFVDLPVRKEALALIYLPLFTYCVCPSGYQGSHCQNRGAHNQEHACIMSHTYMQVLVHEAYLHTLCTSQFQFVVPPVRMEEYADVNLSLLTVSVPEGTKGTPARSEVWTQPGTCIHCVCVRACVRACMRACVCVCVCVCFST